MGRRAQLSPQARPRVLLVADGEPPVARRSRAAPSRGRPRSAGAATLLPRSPFCSKSLVGRAARRLLAVQEDELDRVAGRLMRAGELGRHGRAGRAVVGAHEAGDVLGVVVRAHDHVARLAAAHGADHVAQAARHLLVLPRGTIRFRSRASRRDSGEPAGRGPSSTWRRRSRNAAAPLKRSDVHARGARRLAVRLVVAGERQVVGGDERHQRDSECDLYREHDPQQLHRRECRGCTLPSWHSRVTRTA